MLGPLVVLRPSDRRIRCYPSGRDCDFVISDSSSALFPTRPSRGQGREPGLSHPCSVGHGALLLVMMALDGEMGEGEPPKWGCLRGNGWLGGSSRGRVASNANPHAPGSRGGAPTRKLHAAFKRVATCPFSPLSKICLCPNSPHKTNPPLVLPVLLLGQQLSVPHRLHHVNPINPSRHNGRPPAYAVQAGENIRHPIASIASPC